MFIKEMSCISAQDTYQDAIFENGAQVLSGKQYWAMEPPYKKMVPLNLLRRMSKSVRMGVATGMPLLERNKNIDGIIIGSANGSIQKSISFLHQIIEYKEGTLTPTDFVQSTSNSIAGSLALMSNTTGYNNTHVNNGIAFEAAILDALLLFEEGRAQKLLLGGVEEISMANYNVDSLRDRHKEEELDSTQLLNSNTKGSIPGEGAAMFIVEAAPSAAAVAEIVDVDQICYPTKEDIVEKAQQFLKKNHLAADDIDALFLGYNGDNRTDYYYKNLQQELFPNHGIYVYKNLVADHYTVASFAVWLVAKLFSGAKLPAETIWKKSPKTVNKVLIYNHYEGTQHGFILMARP